MILQIKTEGGIGVSHCMDVLEMFFMNMKKHGTDMLTVLKM